MNKKEIKEQINKLELQLEEIEDREARNANCSVLNTEFLNKFKWKFLSEGYATDNDFEFNLEAKVKNKSDKNKFDLFDGYIENDDGSMIAEFIIYNDTVFINFYDGMNDFTNFVHKYGLYNIDYSELDKIINDVENSIQKLKALKISKEG